MTVNQTISLFDAATPQVSTFVILACITAGSLFFIAFDCLCFKQTAQADIEVVGDFEFSERKGGDLDNFEQTKNFYDSNLTN